MPRSTHIQLLKMKKKIFDSCYRKQMLWKDGAKLLGLHPKSLSRLKKNYELLGECVLVGRKPGPKIGTPNNKTSEKIERLVERLAESNSNLGPVGLSEKLLDEHGHKLNQSTVWRILKRRKIRYTTNYKRFKKDPKLYCLDEPGIEVQLDGCYPFGRSRKIVCYAAIDDCSRFVFGKCFAGVERDELAIQFVSELVRRMPFRIQTLRVDNRYGRQFEKFCKSIGIKIHRNDPYSPQQNGKIERFNRTNKSEFFRKLPWAISLEEMNYQFQLWLHYYNHSRRHGGFGMNRLTPVEKLIKTYLELLSQADFEKVTGTLQWYILRWHRAGL